MTGETEVEKEVTMVGYDADKDYGGSRRFLNSLVDRDMAEKRKTEERNVEVELDLRDSRDITRRLSTLDFDEDKLDELKNLADGELLSVKDETNIRSSYRNSSSAGAADFAENIAESIPDVIEVCGEEMGVDESHHRRTRWSTDDGRCHLAIKRFKVQMRRILSKEGKRESDDMYETMAKVPSISFKVEMVADDDAVIDALSEDIIPILHKEMAKHQPIGKVRYTSCQRQQRVKGECYNI